MAPKYGNIHYDRSTYSKWYAHFGHQLPVLMRTLVSRERLNTGIWIPIYIVFQGNPKSFSKDTVLEALCLRKPAEVPNFLGRLMGKKATPYGKLIVLQAVNLNEPAKNMSFFEKLVEKMRNLFERFIATLAKDEQCTA